MAFLDNSGDIILDAVLTDLGRKRLAEGNFRITQFALGDDEIDYSLPIPSSKQHLHFGLGQTETNLDLAEGEYQLQLILGNKYHIPHQPPLESKKIKVTVIP